MILPDDFFHSFRAQCIRQGGRLLQLNVRVVVRVLQPARLNIVQLVISLFWLAKVECDSLGVPPFNNHVLGPGRLVAVTSVS